MNLLKVFRARKGFTQKDLAEKVSVSRHMIQLYESQKAKPGDFNFYAICEALDLSQSEMTELLLWFYSRQSDDLS